MKRYASVVVASLVAAALTASGCAWRTPFSTSPPPPSASEMLSQSSSKRDLASKTNALTKSFQNAGKSLTPKSKVLPPPDPLALSTKTPKIGPDLHVIAARQLENQGANAKAEEHYRTALGLAPGNADIQVSLARLLHREGRIDESIRLYQQVLAANPKHAVAANDLGLCQARNGQLNESCAALAKAVEWNPQSKLYRNNLATVLVEMGRNQDAFQHLCVAHGDAAAHYNLGVLLKQRGQDQLAMQNFQRAAELDSRLALPSDVVAANPSEESLSLAQRNPIQVSEASALQSGAPYRVGDATAEAAPYRLPRQKSTSYGGDFDSGNPQMLPPVRKGE